MSKLIERCGGHFPVGLFYLDKELWTDEGVKQAADTGADFLVAVESTEPLVTLCEKYKLGIVSISNITPLWWGGDGKNAGKYAEQFPLERLEEVNNYPANSVLWGDYLVDEPNSKDFLHIDIFIKQYKSLSPGQFPFVNLYPGYGSIPKNSSDEIILQLGNGSYADYIDQYVREINLPYICFDYYPFTGVFAGYLENLDSIAKACKKSGREMWVIIQAGAWESEKNLNAYQIDWQAYMCLAYGAKAIMAASYSKGWWDETTSCVNRKGEKNETYGFVKDLFSALHSPFGTEFLNYDYLCTVAYGDIESSENRIRPQLERQNKQEKPPDLPDIKITSDKAIVAGYFKNENGYALMIVNSHNPFDGSVIAEVKLETDCFLRITILKPDNSTESAIPLNKFSAAEIKIQSGQGVFITICHCVRAKTASRM